jgi:hypothetical protein
MVERPEARPRDDERSLPRGLFSQLRSSKARRAGITVLVERGRARSRCLSPALHTELSTRSARLISP